MFNKRIPNYKVRDSLLVMIVGFVVTALVAIIVFYTLSTPNNHDRFTVINSFFESASAFGTVGLSMGITQDIGVVGSVFLIILMFIGQMGVSVTLLS
jgi:Trk-type K+ transport system membrane component